MSISFTQMITMCFGNFFICKLFIYFSILTLSQCNQEILGCGGFVKSIVNINYSKVLVKLLTSEGTIKYVTDCAPNNGYYFIPLYDKGDYILQIEPPKGWRFEPEKVNIKIDESRNDPCSLQQDINFIFKGFAISGRITTKGSDVGPAGIQVKLKDKQSSKLINSITTQSGGQLKFDEIFPGNYIIEVSHASWKFASNTHDVSVKDDNIELKDSQLKILGYDVSGFVKSDGEPFAGVIFALYSKQKSVSIPGCDSKLVSIPKAPNKDYIYVCHSYSNENGLFKFQSVPIGTYKLIPFYKGKNFQFDVQPDNYDFVVEHGDFDIDTEFSVEGFGVSGRVVIQKDGDGVSGAEVTITGQDNKSKTVPTQNNGIFHFDNIKTGVYTISVKANHIYFNKISVKISPGTSQLEEIIASSFDVCGQLDLKMKHDKITLTAEGNNNKNAEADENGNFCFILEPGSYKISPTNLRNNLRFKPTFHEIKVSSSPLFNLKFTQFTASVFGSIIAKKAVGSDIELKLLNKNTNKELFWKSDAHHTQSTANYLFKDLLPGSYQLLLSKKSNELCWQKDLHSFEITDHDIEHLDFVQEGFLMSITFSHSISLKIKSPSGKIHNLKVEKNVAVNKCLGESGIYHLTPIGCHQFSETNNEVIIFDTNKDSGKLISKTAVKHVLNAKVITNSNVTDIEVMLKSKLSGKEEILERMNLFESKVIEDKNLFEYKLSVFVKPFVSIYLEPISSQLLFKPSSFEVKVEDDCLEDAITFHGKKGLFINGSITPKLENVLIKVLSNDVEMFTTKSDAFGNFVAGPFDNDIQLEIKPEKDDYIFKQIDGKFGNFEALKLAKIIVRIKNNKREPLSDVLISLSGGSENYRKNVITPQGGEVIFNGLYSGEYFIRIMMKEYEFDPATKMIQVNDGQTIELNISAKKVAFSCNGIVVSLNGEPEPGVLVGAFGIKPTENNNINCLQYQEEALTEANGTFKIKGLWPSCEYEIKLNLKNEKNKHIERMISSNQIVRVQDTDYEGIRLIILRRIGHMDVGGDVLTEPHLLSSLKVRLFSEVNPDHPVSTLALGSSFFFFFPSIPIDNRNYFIRMETSLSSNLYEIDSPVRSFRANTSYIHFTFNFNLKSRGSNLGINSDHESVVSQGSFYTLPSVVILTIIIYNYSKLSSYFTELFQKFSNSNFKFPFENTLSQTKRKNKAVKIN